MGLVKELPTYRRNLAVQCGSGCWLYGEDGRKYLDLYGGHAVASLGYGDGGWIEVLNEAASNLTFQSNSVQLRAREEALGALSQAIPGNFQALFVNSGAEANENALRMALRINPRPKIAAVEGSFHGRTAAAAAVTWGSQRWNVFSGQLFEVVWLKRDDPESAKAITDEVSAVIVEPVQGVGGAWALSDEFLAALQTQASKAGALVIADEVQTGAGRTGEFLACTSTPLSPDIITLGKGIAGGYPVGVTLLRDGLLPDLPIGSFGTTFGGGPIASALTAYVVERIAAPEFLKRVRNASKRLRDEINHPKFIAPSGKGLLMGWDVEGTAQSVQSELLAKGVIVGDCALPHRIRLLPPLVLGDPEINHFLKVLKEIPA